MIHNTHLVWVDDESEVQQVIVIGEVDLARLWQVELIDVCAKTENNE